MQASFMQPHQRQVYRDLEFLNHLESIICWYMLCTEVGCSGVWIFTQAMAAMGLVSGPNGPTLYIYYNYIPDGTGLILHGVHCVGAQVPILWTNAEIPRKGSKALERLTKSKTTTCFCPEAVSLQITGKVIWKMHCFLASAIFLWKISSLPTLPKMAQHSSETTFLHGMQELCV